MGISSSGRSRPQYYDRTPISNHLNYAANGIGPHAAVTRAAYTVPANKKAFVSSCFTKVLRQTAAAPVGIVEASCVINNASRIAQSMTLGNAVNDSDAGETFSGTALAATDVFIISTTDNGTAGTVAYRCSAQVIEFDA